MHASLNKQKHVSPGGQRRNSCGTRDPAGRRASVANVNKDVAGLFDAVSSGAAAEARKPRNENQGSMKFSLAAGTRPKADAFGLKSAGLNSTSKPKKSFSFSKMIPRQAALFAKTMRGGPPKLKAEARVAAAAPTSPVVYGPPPPPNFTRTSVVEPRATPPKRPAEAEATPPTANKRARDFHLPGPAAFLQSLTI